MVCGTSKKITDDQSPLLQQYATSHQLSVFLGEALCYSGHSSAVAECATEPAVREVNGERQEMKRL